MHIQAIGRPLVDEPIVSGPEKRDVLVTPGRCTIRFSSR